MTEINRIFVRGTNWVGDAVMTIPALRHLRAVFPAAKITLHTRGWARGIFEDADFIDEIETFEKTESKIKDALAQSAIVRAGNFDLAVLFPNSFETALVAKLGGIKRRFGYARDARAFLLTDAVTIPEWKNERHEVYYYLHLVAAIEKKLTGATAVSTDEPQVDLPISEARQAAARVLLEANGVDPSRKTVALGVGATNSRAKRWQPESYAKLNDLLQAESKANVVLVGAGDEEEISAAVHAQSRIKPIVLTGKTTLAEAAAILSAVDLMVSNDMGLAHIAAATGTKTLVIFGPTNPLTTKPWNAEIIYKKVECAPCMLRDCPIDHRCLTRISAEEVYEKAQLILGN